MMMMTISKMRWIFVVTLVLWTIVTLSANSSEPDAKNGQRMSTDVHIQPEAEPEADGKANLRAKRIFDSIGHSYFGARFRGVDPEPKRTPPTECDLV